MRLRHRPTSRSGGATSISIVRAPLFIEKGYPMFNKAFTLIELLIVVAIIAILAAVAVPNFLEAQVRAKVARAKADHRTIATGLETYQVDNNVFPSTNWQSWALTFGAIDPRMLPTLERLTTPIAYLTGESTFYDPFKAKAQYSGANLNVETPLEDVNELVGAPADAKSDSVYRYIARGARVSAIWNAGATISQTERPTWYLLESAGPDQHFHRIAGGTNTWLAGQDSSARRGVLAKAVYDATNGTVSRGSIWRGGGGSGQGSYFKEVISQAK